jgi:hypothetical protein
MKLTRREFVRMSVAGAAGMLLSASAAFTSGHGAG